MKKTLILSLALATGVLVMATIPSGVMHGGAQAANAITGQSTGHNLKLSRHMAFDAQPAPLKQLAHDRAAKRIDINALRHASAPVYTTSATAAMAESFESCSLLSDNLPDGWTRVTNIESAAATDHWHGISRQYAAQWYFPMPADGNMMMVMFYDDYYKDEMLVSPEVTVPASGDYSLSYYWYTTPLWLYVIDRYHVDQFTKEFIVREQAFNFQVQIREAGGDWTTVYDLESQFADYSYAELSELQYSELQRNDINLEAYAGKTIQIGFRYFGTDGDALFLDGISIDLPAPEAYYVPSPSVLYYGLSQDDNFVWIGSSIEFNPVSHPIYWYNYSDNAGGVTYQWTYSDIDDNGQMVTRTSDDQEMLAVTYHPDYHDAASLMNNWYYLPELTARAANGASSSYQGPSQMLQAGGTTEFDFGADNGGYRKYTAFSFDLEQEGMGIHAEDDDELGFLAEPIFGYSENHDAWWEHYSYPTGAEGRYSYVDGFANMIIPYDEAPIVVYGATAYAYGTIYDGAELHCKVFRINEEGQVEETPVVDKTISGRDVKIVPSGSTQNYLVLDFRFDTPVVLSLEDAGYGYLVEVSGYHDKNIRYFAPLQSLVPNKYEWCLGFYHHYWPYNDNLTQAMSYVAFFTNDDGEDLYSSFAIGLDAHYPWLQVEGDNKIEISDGVAKSQIKGYYAAEDYTIEAPDWLDVTLAGRYVTDVTMSVVTDSDTDRTGKVRISAPAVSCEFDVTAKAGAGIANLVDDVHYSGPVYNLQGIQVRESATYTDIDHLPAGIYIYNGKKIKK